MDATPMKASIDTIAKIIKNDMLTKVLAAHKTDQANLNTLDKQILACRTTRVSQLKAADATRAKYKLKSADHKPCRKIEDSFYTANEKYKTEQRSLKAIKELKCKAYSD